MKKLILTALALSLFACSSSDETPQEQSQQTATDNTKVWAVGYKSSVLTAITYNLQEDTYTELSGYNFGAKIYKKGNDIYVSGIQNNGNNPKTIGYYKNGTFNQVGTGLMVRNIFVDDMNNIYLCGTNANQKPCYWKNNQMIELSTKQGNATDMKVVGNDIYVSGTYFNNNTTYIVASWKNGLETTYGSLNLYNNYLPDTLVEVDGSDIYIYGVLSNGGGKIWKNGQDLQFSLGLNPIEFQRIGNQFYFSGWSNTNSVQVAAYGSGVTSGTITKVSTAQSLIHDFKVKGNDIYCCGHENLQAIIWKNNTVLKKLPNNNTIFTDLWIE